MNAKIRTTLMIAGVLMAGAGASVLAETAAKDMGEARGIAAADRLPSARPASAPTTMLADNEPAPDVTAPRAQGSVVLEPAAGSAAPAQAPAAIVEPPVTEPPLPSIEDPAGTLADLVQFARSGLGRLAVGAAIVLLVWLLRRHVFRRVAWFSTTLGGYVAAFGSTALLYVGGVLGADMALTIDVIADALATGFAASGQREAARDVGRAAKAHAAKVATVAVVALSASAALLVAGSCGAAQGPRTTAVIECSLEHQDKIAALVLELRPLLSGEKPNIAAAVLKAAEAGVAVGACALAKLAEEPTGATLTASVAGPAREALERFRAEHAGGAAIVGAQ